MLPALSSFSDDIPMEFKNDVEKMSFGEMTFGKITFGKMT